MLRKISVGCLLIVFLGLAYITTIHAQRRGAYRGRVGRTWYRSGYRGGFGFNVNYVSPAEGMAQVIRARGDAAVSYSKAAINTQEARSKYMDNHKKYVEMRRELKAKGEADRQEYHAKKRAAREKRQAGQRVAARPSSLTDSQLDPNTGKIYWPNTLKDIKFKKDRDIIDEAFILRRTYSHNTTDTQQNVQEAAKNMLRTLKSNIREIPSGDYIAARRFLELLQNEVRT